MMFLVMFWILDYKRRTVVTTANSYDNMTRYALLKIVKTFVVHD
jgi:hypothetical protein